MPKYAIFVRKFKDYYAKDKEYHKLEVIAIIHVNVEVLHIVYVI